MHNFSPIQTLTTKKISPPTLIKNKQIILLKDKNRAQKPTSPPHPAYTTKG